MTSFMVIIILYSIRVITIFIIDRRHAFIIVKLLIKAWGTKNIIFIKHSFPKLVALHIISIMDIQGIHTNNIEIMLIIQRLVPNILMHSSSNTLAQFSFPSYSRKILKR